MTKKLTIAIAAGLMFAGQAIAADRTTARTHDQKQDATQTQDTDVAGAPDPAKDAGGAKTSAGLGAQVKVLAQDQKTGEGATGIGAQVRDLARFHGCEQSGSAECKARVAAHEALAEKAGAPAEKPSLPGAAADRGQTERNQVRTRTDEAEQAALRHSQRMAGGQDVDDMHSNGHRAGHGDGHGMGDSMQGAETKRSGDAHPMGTGGGMTPGGRMP
jgi:hypothetical protein